MGDKFRIVTPDDAARADERAKDRAQILEELAGIEAGVVSGEVKGVLVIVLGSDGEAYPLVHQMGDTASVVGLLELVKQSIILSAFAVSDDDDDDDDDNEPSRD